MRHPIQFEVEELAEGDPASGYRLIMATVLADGARVEEELQTGYRSVAQAQQALKECLTYTAPDMSMYDEAVSHVGTVIDSVAAINDAMQEVGNRLNTVEDRLDQALPPPKLQGGSSLLPPRGSQHREIAKMQPIMPPAPPPIRRPATIPHQPGGGAFRPGQGGVDE